jgi:NADP-dependent 3-hydroxy acid dehydrogenase YdfG
MSDPVAREKSRAAREKMAIPAAAIADAIAFAIGQPDNVDVGEIVVRPTAQA